MRGTLHAEVYQPGDNVVHGIGTSVAEAFMPDGLPAHGVILVIEGEGHKDGSSELGRDASDALRKRE